ncbi:thioesterase family protein [Algihabitans albus]|uniref:thioesterase family protein n=1 Tax=Algihabitans albus TaxID=2164067 RepID=UPI000E5CC0EE|nr:thioesterase family protein [Algihabitans albus]
MPFDAALELQRTHVQPEWLDYNGHMNVGYYVVAFDQAFDLFMDRIGIDAAYRESSGGTIFSVEAHVTYLQELLPDAPLVVTLQLLGWDSKKLNIFLRMYHAEEGFLAATLEWMSLHVDLETRRAAPMAPEVAARVEAVWQAHKDLPRPPQAGRGISLNPPK